MEEFNILKITRSPAVAGMGSHFRDVEMIISIGLIEETQSLNFALILVVTVVMGD